MNQRTDSLFKVFASKAAPGPADTALIKIINDHAVVLRKKGLYDTCYLLVLKARELTEKLEKLHPQKFQRFVLKQLSFADITEGNVHNHRGNSPRAVECYLSALKRKELLNDKNGIAVALNNIGNVYEDMGENQKALGYYFSALKINRERGNKGLMGRNYNNIGSIYLRKKDFSAALSYFQLSLKMKKEAKDKKAIPYTIINLGAAYEVTGKLKEAGEMYAGALQQFKDQKDNGGITLALQNIGALRLKEGKFAEARKWLTQSLDLAKEIRYMDELRDSYFHLSVTDSALGDYRSSLQNYKMYVTYRDSMNNEESNRKIMEQQLHFDFEKKEAVSRAEEEKRNVVFAEAIKRQKQQRNFLLVGFVLVGVIALIALSGYRQKKKSNQLLENKNLIIEEKQREILASIQYAGKIQSSLLPSEKYIERMLDRLRGQH